MSHTFGQDQSSTVSGEVRVYLAFTSGATGAVPATLTTGAGITSVTYGATGIYTIVFMDNYNKSLDMVGNVMQASYSASGACRVRKVSQSFTLGICTMVITTETAAGAAVAMASGDILECSFTLATYNSQ